ncbi:MAG: hypothetical protein WAQ98_27435 [Blastocatellia bacterium]
MSGKPKSPAELEKMLKEMESLSKPSETPKPTREGGGALKSLLGFFVKIHDDEQEQTPAKTAPPTTTQPLNTKTQPLATPSGKIEPPVKKVADLVNDEPTPKFNSPITLDQGEDLSSKTFEEIYLQAGVVNNQRSVDEIISLMQSPTVANQPLSVKVVAVNLALMAKGTKIDDYIADAVRKDRALDAYQLMLNERSREVEEKTKTGLEKIQKEVEEYLKKKQQEMEKLRAQASEAGRQSVEFSVRRQVEEQRLADAISPFLEGKPNPVSVGNTPERSDV